MLFLIYNIEYRIEKKYFKKDYSFDDIQMNLIILNLKLSKKHRQIFI